MANKQVEEKSSRSFDWMKWSLIGILIAGGVWANYNYRQIDWALRFVGWIFLVCFLLFIVLQTGLGRNTWRFCKEARWELRKVVWPTRPETIQTTMIVIAMVIFMSIILWALDSCLLGVVSLLSG
jgi:preprotein translocase subunit SecE